MEAGGYNEKGTEGEKIARGGGTKHIPGATTCASREGGLLKSPVHCTHNSWPLTRRLQSTRVVHVPATNARCATSEWKKACQQSSRSREDVGESLIRSSVSEKQNRSTEHCEESSTS